MISTALLRQRQHLAKMALPARPLSTTGGGRGAGLFQRLSSFFVGAGLTALLTQYYIFEELRTGNQEILRKQREIENRLTALEK